MKKNRIIIVLAAFSYSLWSSYKALNYAGYNHNDLLKALATRNFKTACHLINTHNDIYARLYQSTTQSQAQKEFYPLLCNVLFDVDKLTSPDYTSNVNKLVETLIARNVACMQTFEIDPDAQTSQAPLFEAAKIALYAQPEKVTLPIAYRCVANALALSQQDQGVTINSPVTGLERDQAPVPLQLALGESLHDDQPFLWELLPQHPHFALALLAHNANPHIKVPLIPAEFLLLRFSSYALHFYPNRSDIQKQSLLTLKATLEAIKNSNEIALSHLTAHLAATADQIASDPILTQCFRYFIKNKAPIKEQETHLGNEQINTMLINAKDSYKQIMLAIHNSTLNNTPQTT